MGAQLELSLKCDFMRMAILGDPLWALLLIKMHSKVR